MYLAVDRKEQMQLFPVKLGIAEHISSVIDR